MENLLIQLQGIPYGDASSSGYYMSENILKKLNILSNLFVYPLEITFKTADDRKNYCDMAQENIEQYALSHAMLSDLQRTSGTMFLCSNRDTRANTFAYSYSNASTSTARNLFAQQNREDTLDWHQNVIFYKDNSIFYFEPNFSPDSTSFDKTLRSVHFRSKINDFLSLAPIYKVPVRKIYIAGNNITWGCRERCVQFIKDVVESRIRGELCSKYSFYEVTKGPRPPTREMEIVNSV